MRSIMSGGLSISLRCAIVAKPMNEPITGMGRQEIGDGLTTCWSGRGKLRRSAWFVCAGHGTELTRCKASCQGCAEPKARRRARASPRGGVCRQPYPNARGDAQERERRCGTRGASGHVTTKPSRRDWGVLENSSADARNARCLTPGGLPWAIREG
jgi:hypothetical protein